jgi:hypothetical protein
MRKSFASAGVLRLSAGMPLGRRRLRSSTCLSAFAVLSHQLKFGRLGDRQVGGLRALENAAGRDAS